MDISTDIQSNLHCSSYLAVETSSGQLIHIHPNLRDRGQLWDNCETYDTTKLEIKSMKELNLSILEKEVANKLTSCRICRVMSREPWAWTWKSESQILCNELAALILQPNSRWSLLFVLIPVVKSANADFIIWLNLAQIHVKITTTDTADRFEIILTSTTIYLKMSYSNSPWILAYKIVTPDNCHGL